LRCNSTTFDLPKKKAARWLNPAAFVVANGGGWLTTEQLSICAQEGMVGNGRE
jgi:hypothetical protein